MGDTNSKIGQLKKIKTGEGLSHILDKVYEIMKNPALIFDMDYKLIAKPTSVVSDDPIWCEFMTHGRLTERTIGFFKDESFIDSVANCTQFEGVTYLFSDKLKYDRIFGQLYNKDCLPVADLVMVACEKPFEENTPELIKTVCNIISGELSKDNFYQDYGQDYQNSIVQKLLEGSIEDKGVYSGHISNIEKDLEPFIYIAAADVSKPDLADKDLSHFIDLFKRTQPAFKYFKYDNYIVILISTHNPTLIVEKDLAELLPLQEQENIFVGISSCFENLFDSRRYYLEAVSALNKNKEATDRQRVTQSE